MSQSRVYGELARYWSLMSDPSMYGPRTERWRAVLSRTLGQGRRSRTDSASWASTYLHT